MSKIATPLLALLMSMPLITDAGTAAHHGAGRRKFVPLPDCSALPADTVKYSRDGLLGTSVGEPNTLAPSEAQQGWHRLFDGQSTQGWHGFDQKILPGTWRVNDGALVTTKWHEGDPVDDRGDLRTDEAYANFELRLQWATEAGGNSGVFYMAREGVADSIWKTAAEMQVLDDERHEDGLEPIHRAGSAYDVYAPKCNALRPVGEYNDARLIVRDGHVEHWLNGYQVVEYQVGTPDWRARVARSKFKGLKTYAQAGSGYIALQDHGDVVRFRSIRILPDGKGY